MPPGIGPVKRLPVRFTLRRFPRLLGRSGEGGKKRGPEIFRFERSRRSARPLGEHTTPVHPSADVALGFQFRVAPVTNGE